MSFGATSQIINAQRVKLLRGATELTLLSDLRVTYTRTVDRVNTRAGAIDTFRWKVEEVEAVVQLTELLKTQLQTDRTIDGNSAMTYNNWTINGVSISGSAGDNTSDTVSATLVDTEDMAPENGIAQVRLKLRVAGGAD